MTSDWALDASASHVYSTDEAVATVRLVCVPAVQLDLDNSALNCSDCKSLLSQVPRTVLTVKACL